MTLSTMVLGLSVFISCGLVEANQEAKENEPENQIAGQVPLLDTVLVVSDSLVEVKGSIIIKEKGLGLDSLPESKDSLSTDVETEKDIEESKENKVDSSQVDTLITEVPVKVFGVTIVDELDSNSTTHHSSISNKTELMEIRLSENGLSYFESYPELLKENEGQNSWTYGVDIPLKQLPLFWFKNEQYYWVNYHVDSIGSLGEVNVDNAKLAVLRASNPTAIKLNCPSDLRVDGDISTLHYSAGVLFEDEYVVLCEYDNKSIELKKKGINAETDSYSLVSENKNLNKAEYYNAPVEIRKNIAGEWLKVF